MWCVMQLAACGAWLLTTAELKCMIGHLPHQLKELHGLHAPSFPPVCFKTPENYTKNSVVLFVFYNANSKVIR